MRQHVRLEIVTKYYPEAEDAGMGKVQTWTKPDTQCNTNAQNRDLASKPGRNFQKHSLFLQRILTPIITAHFRGLDMYQVVVPMTTSLCLTTKPNFL